MLGDLGVSTLHSIKIMTQFSSLLSIKTSHVACFNAWGLLYECVFEAPCFPRRTNLLGNPFLITSLLNLLSLPFLLFWIIIPAILPTTMLGYYYMSAFSTPS
jgi:hypothetical protein